MLAGRSRVQSIIASAGLPLEIADGEVEEENVRLSLLATAWLHSAILQVLPWMKRRG